MDDQGEFVVEDLVRRKHINEEVFGVLVWGVCLCVKKLRGCMFLNSFWRGMVWIVFLVFFQLFRDFCCIAFDDKKSRKFV